MMRLFFSRPALTRSTASLNSAIVTTCRPLRAASSAASLTRFARSAPTKPQVIAGQRLHVDVRVELDVLHVDFEDLLAAADVGPIDQHVPIESPGPQQGRVERFGPIRGAPSRSRRCCELKPSISTSSALSVCSRSS